jgi:hypothetical protein
MLETLWQILETNYARLGEYASILLILNLVLLVFSRPLVRWLDHFNADKSRRRRPVTMRSNGGSTTTPGMCQTC